MRNARGNSGNSWTWGKAMLALLLIAISPRLASAAMLGEVVVDGEVREFYADDIMDSLTVINGGAALLWGSTVYGNTLVEGEGPEGGSYLGLNGALVDGNVEFKHQGRGSIGWSTISGNLVAKEFLYVNLTGSNVGGNIKMENGGGFTGTYYSTTVGGNVTFKRGARVILSGFMVGGNVEVVENAGDFIEVKNCQINRNLVVEGNTGGYWVKVQDNTVGGNMRVRDNTPQATVSGNEVSGKIELD